MIKLLKRIKIKSPKIILKAVAITLMVGGIGSLTACTRSEEPSVGRPSQDSAPVHSTNSSYSVNPFKPSVHGTRPSKRHARSLRKFHSKKSHGKHTRGKKHAKRKLKGRRVHHAKRHKHTSKRRRHA